MKRFLRYVLPAAGLIASWGCAAALGGEAPRNLVPYSGFDTGVYRLWRSSYQSGCVVDNGDLDSAIAHDGPFSLRLRAYERG